MQKSFLDELDDGFVLESIQSEELIDLKESLMQKCGSKDKVDEEATMQILRILDRKAITFAQIKETMVGKAMTHIVDNKAWFANSEIVDKATNLRNIWRNIMTKEKERETRRKEEMKKKMLEIKKAGLPYIPRSVKVDDLYKNSGLAKKFIEVL